ncbi:MAG: hypothetical protein IKX24_01305 [Prevotella sp.]|nr:hypothetical protein [Prevotella sp.]
MDKETVMHRYIAVQRTGTDKIAKGAKVAFESEREVEESTGFSFRKEIASACREQLGVDIAQNEEATVGTTFDVYSEAKYAELREKEEAEAEKRREKEAAEEEKRQLREAEKRLKEMEKAEAAEKKRNSRGSSSARNKSKKQKTIFGGFSLKDWRKLFKFIIGVVVVVWFIFTYLKDCSFDSIVEDIKNKAEEVVKPTSSTQKKTTTTKRKSTTTTKKGSAAANKSTSSTKKKSTSTQKKSTSTKRKTTTKKKRKTSSSKE